MIYGEFCSRRVTKHLHGQGVPLPFSIYKPDVMLDANRQLLDPDILAPTRRIHRDSEVARGCTISGGRLRRVGVMREIGFSLVVLAVLGIASFAQASPQQSTNAAENAPADSELLAKSTICAELMKSVDVKKVKPGDPIAARVTLAVLARGKVVIPNGTKITGQITEVKLRSHGKGESELGILFNRAVLRDGSELQLALTVQAIGRASVSPADAGYPEAYGASAHDTRVSSTAPAPTTRTTGLPPPRPQTSDTPQPASPNANPQDPRRPILDAGSHGVVGLRDLTLTESPDATRGSTVTSQKRNVKLEGGTEMILRVIGESGGEDVSRNR